MRLLLRDHNIGRISTEEVKGVRVHLSLRNLDRGCDQRREQVWQGSLTVDISSAILILLCTTPRSYRPGRDPWRALGLTAPRKANAEYLRRTLVPSPQTPKHRGRQAP